MELWYAFLINLSLGIIDLDYHSILPIAAEPGKGQMDTFLLYLSLSTDKEYVPSVYQTVPSVCLFIF